MSRLPAFDQPRPSAKHVTGAFRRTPESPPLAFARRAWAAISPFARALRDGARPTATLGVGAMLLAEGVGLAWPSDWWLLDRVSPIAPKLAPWVILTLLHLARVALLVGGAIYASSGSVNLRNWWLTSAFAWRTVPIGEDGDYRVEARPFARAVSGLVLGSIAAGGAIVAAFFGLALVASAVCVDRDLAHLVAHFVNGGVGRHELIAGRALLIVAAMIAVHVALNRRRAAILHFGKVP